MEAMRLRDNQWVVRPKGCLGTCGWSKGRPWIAVFVKARNAEEAMRKAEDKVWSH